MLSNPSPITDCNDCVIGGAGQPQACPFSCRFFPAGAPIVHQGANCEKVQFIKRGLVVISSCDEEGNETTCGLRGVGSVVSWEVLAGHAPNHLAVALAPTEICSLSRAEVHEWMGQNSKAPAVMMELAIGEIQTNTVEKRLLKGSADMRLATFLLERHRAGLANRPVEIEHQLLARLLGVRAETLSRAHKRLRERGALRPERGMFIANLDKLTQVAASAP